MGRVISNVHGVRGALGGRLTKEVQKPLVAPHSSVKPDYIVCLEDGKNLKMLKRHLRTRYQMTPDEYRRKWGLVDDYPMAAPNYAKTRSDLAKSSSLGTKAHREAK